MENGNSLRKEYLPRYIYDDYSTWEGKWELIGGIAYAMMPLPSIAPQRISGNIHTQLHDLLKSCGKCQLLLPVDWKVAEDTVVQPDNMVVCGEVGGNFLTIPPTVIFEILSPATALKDKNLKYEIYQSQGVRYYVIVDVAGTTYMNCRTAVTEASASPGLKLYRLIWANAGLNLISPGYGE